MALARIQGVYRNSRCEFDDGQKVFFVCELEKNETIAEGSWPGLMIDDGRRWPLLMTIEDAEAELRFSDGTSYETNFCQRPVRSGELFTVGDGWVYQIKNCHPLNSAELGGRMAKVEAICVDQKRLESHELALWCYLDKLGKIMSGEFIGYCIDDGFKTPIEVTIGDIHKVDYGGGWHELTSLRSGRIGEKFTITSADDNGLPDVYTYKIISASFC